jgi:hypothetical protein
VARVDPVVPVGRDAAGPVCDGRVAGSASIPAERRAGVDCDHRYRGHDFVRHHPTEDVRPILEALRDGAASVFAVALGVPRDIDASAALRVLAFCVDVGSDAGLSGNVCLCDSSNVGRTGNRALDFGSRLT